MQIVEELLEAMNDVIAAIPKVALASLILLISLLIIRLTNRMIRWLVKTGKLEEGIRELFPEGTRLPLARMFSLLADSLILIAASAAIIRIFVPEQAQLYSEAMIYLTRIGSVVILTLVSIVLTDALVKSMRFEKKTERFFLMLISLIIATLIIDLVNLTYEIKFALSLGFAIGIGALVGVFSAWAFFGEYLERKMSSRSESSVEDA
ncbi:hypothetical protein D9Q81_07115 [Candidatus Korarchaeum cryptofilum]|jgi:hypothetical protein|uniref:Mechanosensitive ion channel family protein n=1 Tax=Candidatus Korarchaeum cryptofilum TaxID=498846 RepID=A0A3R9PQG1_9CREN|nr:hypothetical protein [Candidatus Korarchaeum cryptofilum]RSN68043.1 hypothetical protein D9Q81_07115 [Candidatus Korarchaeum cryptofilum]